MWGVGLHGFAVVLATLLVAVQPAFAHLSEQQKERAERLINLFENGTTEVNYDYVESLNDGRGYTCGRAGFTTGTGDALLLIEEYTKQLPTNPLAKFLPRLQVLAQRGSGEIVGLEGYAEAFNQAAADPLFRALQDQFQDDLYYYPAMQIAESLGLHSPVAHAVLYDTIIQHGEGDDPDGLGTIIAKTESIFSGSPAEGVVDEIKFIITFLRIRRAILASSHDPESREEWAESVGRVDVLMQIIQRRNFTLDGPIIIQTGEYDEVVE
jgi:chitosanase